MWSVSIAPAVFSASFYDLLSRDRVGELVFILIDFGLALRKNPSLMP
jgi:hypothetical protein